MNICVMFDYEIDYVCNYCYLNEDRDFVSKTLKDSFTVDGGNFLNLICSRINDSNFFEIEITDAYIRIGYFDPDSGESSDSIYNYKIIQPNS